MAVAAAWDNDSGATSRITKWPAFDALRAEADSKRVAMPILTVPHGPSWATSLGTARRCCRGHPVAVPYTSVTQTTYHHYGALLLLAGGAGLTKEMRLPLRVGSRVNEERANATPKAI